MIHAAGRQEKPFDQMPNPSLGGNINIFPTHRGKNYASVYQKATTKNKANLLTIYVLYCIECYVKHVK